MAGEKILEEKPLTLSHVGQALEEIESRDGELSFVGKKVKEYLQGFEILTAEQRDSLNEKILALDNKRLKEEHIVKIIDFLPQDIEDLKIVLQNYPLSLPKKDQEALVSAVKDVL